MAKLVMSTIDIELSLYIMNHSVSALHGNRMLERCCGVAGIHEGQHKSADDAPLGSGRRRSAHPDLPQLYLARVGHNGWP